MKKLRIGEITWEAVSAISTAIGTVTIVLSLLYVGHELKQNTAAARSEVFRNFRAEVADWQMAVALDQNLASLIDRTFHRGERRADLSYVEAVQMGTACLSLLNLYEACFLAGQEKILQEKDVQSIVSSSRLWNIPFVHDSWALWRTELGEEFVEYFESMYPNLKDVQPIILTNGVAFPGQTISKKENFDSQPTKKEK